MASLKKFGNNFRSADGKDFQVTYFELKGSKPGPVLSIVSGLHGSEHSGGILLNKLIPKLEKEDFAGTVRICPAANPLALSIDFYYYPENHDVSKINDYYYSIFRHHYCPWGLTVNTKYNMGHAWNQKVGGIAEDVTSWLWQEIMQDANVIIDMHCLQADKPLSFTMHQKGPKFAKYFGVEAIHPLGGGEESGNLLYQGCVKDNQYCFCIEFSKQHGIRQSEYKMGQDGVSNTMKAMRMIEGDIVHNHNVYLLKEKDVDVVAESFGHPYYVKELYAEVKKGDKVFEIIDLETNEVTCEALAPIDGLVSFIQPHPLFKNGDVVMGIRPFDVVAEAGEPMEKVPEGFFEK